MCCIVPNKVASLCCQWANKSKGKIKNSKYFKITHMKTQNKNTAVNIEKTVIESMYQETKETIATNMTTGRTWRTTRCRTSRA